MPEFLAAMQSSISQRFSSLEAELQRAFRDVQQEVAKLRQDIDADLAQHLEHKGDLTAEVPVPSPSPLLAAEVSPLDHMVLKDTSITVTMTMAADLGHHESSMSIGALVLQQSAAALQEGTSSQPVFRLNSHLMEISQKAGEVVETTSRMTKNRLGASSSPSYMASMRPRSATKSLQSEFDTCNSLVVPPNSKFRVGWDFASVTLIILDAFLLPLTLAFDLDVAPFANDRVGGDVLLQALALMSLIFWPLDMLMSFNTGFYKKGSLQLKRRVIALNYLRTWFAFDVCVLAVDYAAGFVGSEEQEDLLRPLRSARYLRLLRTLRILRIFKAGKVNVIIENLVISMGRQWLILLFTIGRMLMVIGGVTHVLACIFFVVGKGASDVQNLTMGSWIQIAGIEFQPPGIQYVHAIGWIVLPPAPPQLDPASGLEHVAAILVFVLTVLVIGSALSILTGTLHEIRQVNNERSRKRRELRIFLQTKAVSTELMMRIMSYADYKMKRHSPIGYDTSLISPVLHAELATFQLGDHLRGHPLYLLTSKIFPLIFAEFCRSLDKTYFSEAESVFIEATIAEHMYITSHGAFSVSTELDMATNVVAFVDEHRYFAEVAMYVEAVMHDCTLTAESFAEVFLLSGQKLADILSHSPACATMFVEYATEFITRYTVPDGEACAQDILEADAACSKNACECNSFYLDLYMDDRKAIRYLSLTPLTSKPGRTASPSSFISKVRDASATMPTLDELRDAFVELDPDHGLHARFSEPKEQERAESSILCLVALVRDDYAAYTRPQRDSTRITKQQWQRLQSILAWAGPIQEKLQAAVILLAIRGIGKFRSLTRQLPTLRRRPEAAVRYILENYADAIPSGDSMSPEMRTWVMDSLELQQEFNFAQMLQGENVAGSLSQLKGFMQTRGGEDTLKFFVLVLLGFMSGLAGGMGSRFMTRSNAETMIMGLNTLKHVLEQDPARLYWTYIYHRGVGLSRTPQNSTDLAVLRLACLCRIHTHKDFSGLRRSWDALGASEQHQLCKHLLADGIQSSAVIFEFLPLCLERAKANPFVTVPCFLEVLVELTQAVRSASPALSGCAELGQMLTVDLADMAAFILMVQNSYIFQSCLTRAKLNTQDDRFYLEITQDNWRRVCEPHTDIIMLATSVRQLARKQGKEPRLQVDDDFCCSV